MTPRAYIVAAAIVALACNPEVPERRRSGDLAYLACAQARAASGTFEVALPPLTMHFDGPTVRITGTAGPRIGIGVLAGLADTSAATRRNMRHYLAAFRKHQVAAVAVVGGLGRTRREITAALTALTAIPVPLLLVPGSEADLYAFRDAVAAMRTRHPQLLDMSLWRKVCIHSTCFVSLPGIHLLHHVQAAGNGCAFVDEDLGVLEEFADAHHLLVLLSPAPPLSSTPTAVDVGRQGVHVGSAALARAMAAYGYAVGIFGFAYESGGTASTAEGLALRPDVWTPSLWLQAGAADALPVVRHTGDQATGMAHVVQFSGKRARYKPIHPPSFRAGAHAP